MATDTRESADPAVGLAEEDDPSRDWYDRSSLRGDFMVMIADQTEEEYFRRCPENQFCEFIDGTVYMPSPVTTRHQFEVQFLAVLLEMFVEDRRGGIVLTGPATLKLRPDCVVEPDLFVLPAGGEPQIHDLYCDLPALMVVEVLSRSNGSHDLNDKAVFYRAAGIIEVLFVDDRDEVLIVHRRTNDGYEIVKIENGFYHSRAIPGFWLEVSWLWTRPRPSLRRCLEAILAGPPV